MKWIDRALQRWRIAKALPFIAPNARILDIGSADGVLFQQLGVTGERGLGIDPTLRADTYVDGVRLVAGFFPKDMPSAEPFEVITMLAVLEHFPPSEYENLQHGCIQFLKPGGRLIITVPSPGVDRILAALKFLKLIDGMSLEEHHDYDVNQTTAIFSAENFRPLKRQTFQLGLNNLFVFERLGRAQIS
ncbi:MAG: methyltransferase domain-containing protein [Limisphaerales bacterium]